MGVGMATTTKEPAPAAPPSADLLYVALCPECRRVIIVVTPTCPGLKGELADVINEGWDLHRMTKEQMLASEFGHAAGCETAPK